MHVRNLIKTGQVLTKTKQQLRLSNPQNSKSYQQDNYQKYSSANNTKQENRNSWHNFASDEPVYGHSNMGNKNNAFVLGKVACAAVGITVLIQQIDELTDAIKTENVEKVKRAIKNGAHINELDSRGELPLIVAINLGNYEIIKLLLKNGADPNYKYSSDRPLDFAIKKGNIPNVKMLLDYGAKGDEELFAAVKQCNVDSFTTLAPHDKTFQEKRYKTSAFLEELAQRCDLERTRKLTLFIKKHYGQIDPGVAPLYAAQLKKNDVVEFFLDNNANVNYQPWGVNGCERLTLLQIALETNNLELAQLLIARGANIDQETACSSRPRKMMNMLKNGESLTPCCSDPSRRRGMGVHM